MTKKIYDSDELRSDMRTIPLPRQYWQDGCKGDGWFMARELPRS